MAAEPAEAETALPELVGEVNTNQTIFARSVLGPDFDRWRQGFLDQGISLRAVDIHDFQWAAAGDTRRAAAAAGETAFFGDLGLDRLIGWQGARLRASGILISGGRLSNDAIDNYLVSSSIAGPNQSRLTELWLDQTLFGGRVSVRVGQLSAHDEFMLQDTYLSLVNNTFGSSQLKTNLTTP